LGSTKIAKIIAIIRSISVKPVIAESLTLRKLFGYTHKGLPPPTNGLLSEKE
jgi:hypothetical protein